MPSTTNNSSKKDTSVSQGENLSLFSAQEWIEAFQAPPQDGSKYRTEDDEDRNGKNLVSVHSDQSKSDRNGTLKAPEEEEGAIEEAILAEKDGNGRLKQSARSQSSQSDPLEEVSLLAHSHPEQWLSAPTVAFEQWIRSPTLNKFRGYSEDSIKVYSAMWSKFVRFCGETNQSPALIDEKGLRTYLLALDVQRQQSIASNLGKQRARSYDSDGVIRQARRYLALLSRVQDHLIQMGIRKDNVAAFVFQHTNTEPQRSDPIPMRNLTVHEVVSAPKRASKYEWKVARDRALVDLVLSAGLTSLQLRELLDDEDQLWIEGNSAWVRPLPSRRGQLRPLPIPLKESSVQSLKEWLSLKRGHIPGPYVFVSTLAGAPMSSSSIYRAVADALEQAAPMGVKFVAPHIGPRTLRHTFATRQFIAGLPMEAVRQWMGHRDIRTTAVYQKIAQAHIKPQ